MTPVPVAAEHFSKTPGAAATILRGMQNTDEKSERGQLVRLDDGDMYVAEAGDPTSPAVVLIHGTVASAVCWDPIVPALADAFHVISVDLLGCGRSTTTTTGRLDVPAQARRVGEALDRLGVRRVTAVGHSAGCMVATALAEQRPGSVDALVLIDMGPDLAAKHPESLVGGLVFAPVVGALLWRLRSETAVRGAARSAFTRPVEIPEALIEHIMGVSRRDFMGMTRGSRDFLKQRGLPDRITPLGLPLLVIFGAEDHRWRASSADAYRVVPGARVELLPGVGHTPMIEDPDRTGALLLDFLKSLQPKEPDADGR